MYNCTVVVSPLVLSFGALGGDDRVPACYATSMVFLEHVGFGARDRLLWMYYWDERDGPDFNGWWITPDYVGNNEFYYQSAHAAPVPSECQLGSWRSPNVEQLQLKRQLNLGFTRSPDGSGLVATGADAALAIIPDHIVKVDLSKFLWREAGLNHGRPMYEACERPTEAPIVVREDRLPARSLLLVGAGVAIGLLAAVAFQQMRRQ